MNTKMIGKGIVVGLTALLLVTRANAAEPAEDFKKLVVKWQAERAEIVREVVHGWLRGASIEAQKERLVRLTQLDVRLANEPNIPLYVTQFKDPGDTAQCVRDIVSTELRLRGVLSSTRTIFEGRSFDMRGTDGTGVPAGSLRLLSWQKGGER